MLRYATAPQAARHIMVLACEKENLHINYLVEIIHRLLAAGHWAGFSTKPLSDLRMEVNRVASDVAKTEADARVVVAGSMPVLEWFSARPEPTLAMLGCVRDVPKMAGVMPDKKPALAKAARRLAALGHNRIVLIVREERRMPKPGAFERWFLELLKEQGIKTGPYNLPDWKDNAAGLCSCMDSLFAFTPPTVLIIDEAGPFLTARLHLAQRGILTPSDVSMIFLDPDPAIEWSSPAVSHVDWDPGAMVRRTLQWAENVARGREDRHKTSLKAGFIEGGTIWPVPQS